VVHANLHARISLDQIATEGVSRDSCDDKYSIRVPHHRVLLKQVARGGCGNQTNSKIASLSCITIST